MIKHEENQSRAIRLYFFWEKNCAGATGERKNL